MCRKRFISHGRPGDPSKMLNRFFFSANEEKKRRGGFHGRAFCLKTVKRMTTSSFPGHNGYGEVAVDPSTPRAGRRGEEVFGGACGAAAREWAQPDRHEVLPAVVVFRVVVAATGAPA